LKLSRSQGATALPPPVIQLAFDEIGQPETTASISFSALDVSRLTALAFQQQLHRHLRRPGMRPATRWVTPAPGKSPTLTSAARDGFWDFSARDASV